ncbi:MAG: hypothetical protein IPH06_09305 [Alphaproteobacteria bacterium]|nr:hypothetical protein [Alphaproteobacteria bacterium]QQS58192.1 MAG: hypothetical protein IPN28_05065 [Alphaproteobacteria bacterium]
MENKIQENPSEAIKTARNYFKEKNYPAALERYKWFFENSIIIDRAYIGVRLSYCLDEWADLAKVYPLAMDTLVEQKNIALNNFNKTNSADSFNDYASICEYLQCSEEAVMVFKNIHNINSALSKKIFRSVSDALLRNKEWNICREYIGNGLQKYENLIKLFDHITQSIKEKFGAEGREIEKDSVEKTKEECLWLLNINFHADDKNGYIILLEKMQADFEHRGYDNIYKEILNDAPKWPK